MLKCVPNRCLTVGPIVDGRAEVTTDVSATWRFQTRDDLDQVSRRNRSLRRLKPRAFSVRTPGASSPPERRRQCAAGSARPRRRQRRPRSRVLEEVQEVLHPDRTRSRFQDRAQQRRDQAQRPIYRLGCRILAATALSARVDGVNLGRRPTPCRRMILKAFSGCRRLVFMPQCLGS